LARDHYAEVTTNPDIALDLATDLYERLDTLGYLRMYTARLAGRLIGYCSMTVSPHPHTGLLIAREDGIYVQPEHRGGTGAGDMLVETSDCLLAQEGIQIVQRSTKVAHNHGPWLQRKGYEMIDITYSKRLGL
jgi:hypothetical protein